MKRPNVIIMTSGLTGSSVLTGLISQAGYWTGETHKKPDYDTYENKELVACNVELMREGGYKGNYAMEFSPSAIQRIARLSGQIDDQPYRQFIEKCNEHEPWIWKDPRLWLTIRYWKPMLDIDRCKFIILTRGDFQCWISSLLRRQIRSYQDSRHYEQLVKETAIEFLQSNGLPHLHVRYEELILHPEKTIRALNGYLNAELTMDDMKAIYHKPLYKSPTSSWFDVAKAMLIYLKNYSERVNAIHTEDRLQQSRSPRLVP